MTEGQLREEIQRLLASEQPQSALLLTDVLCTLDPSSTENLILKASVLFQVREFSGVLRVAKRVLEGNPDCAEAIYLAMNASFELANIKECVSFSEKLLSCGHKETHALCVLGKCSEISYDPAGAAEYYKKALLVDPFCLEALHALSEHRLLDETGMIELIDSLALPSGADALRESLKAQADVKHTTSVDGVPTAVILLQKARQEYGRNNLRQALSLTTELLEQDFYNRDCMCLHLSILVDMKVSPKLFEIAHFLSENNSQAELAVYAIGCFYYSLCNYERAGRYFSRATELDCYFCEAWVAYGHCYAKLEEGEQALNVYRRASNFFPGLLCCNTFIGMQYSRIHQWPIALNFFNDALKLAPADPLTLNEIGVLYTRTKKYPEALNFFYMAYKSLSSNENPSEHFDCIIFNLATVLRKAGKYSEAIKYYCDYVRCRPNASHGYCALGFTHHLNGDIKSAISNYHVSLSIKPDSFCNDLLNRALTADFGQNASGVDWSSPPPAQSTDVTFSTVSKTHNPASSVGDCFSVGRSLTF
ncbi:anaphase-promoting complex subunit 6 [Angomonas deanei]|uniref:Tetratricopeptide repeat, putative n=1 Tax=Angomonas deanei TaxID=59799 RepID=A0A7G2CFV5_9TRYP|nr:anaphase-promoting complex subunit 6 [Angomonas deanei]CAD2218235.1 Tetratricopeptide repeat, putative [Angomonas deanei]|eukprot:EPY30119.1 anaphase-promoting complex subunit 6 [Angomonas deanei]